LKAVNLDDPSFQTPRDTTTGDLQDQLKGRSIAISPDGEWIIVGFLDGTLRIFDKELHQKNTLKHSKAWISEIKFSPDGSTVAVGSHDDAIYI